MATPDKIAIFPISMMHFSYYDKVFVVCFDATTTLMERYTKISFKTVIVVVISLHALIYLSVSLRKTFNLLYFLRHLCICQTM